MSGKTPADRAQARLAAIYGTDTTPQTDFRSIARRTKVPVNLLMALDGGAGNLRAVEEQASRISAAVSAGKPLEAAVVEVAGDEARGRAIIETAYDLADQLQPAPAAPAGSGNDGRVSLGEGLAGVARSAGGGLVRASGGALDALGVAADEAWRQSFSDDPSQETFLRGAGRAAGDAARGVGEGIMEGASEDFKARREGFQPGGNLADPSSWTLGENPNVWGALGLTAEGLGSMAPVVAAGVLTRSPAIAGSIVGGLMGGGEGVETGRQFVQDAAKTLDENGRPVIEGLPEYRALRDGGESHDRAVAELTRRAENDAGFRQGMVAGLGGAATNRILMSADGWLGRGGRLARAGKKGAASALEEGAQEAAEGVAGGSGIEAATGADLDLMEDSFGDFVAGALSGGAMGAGAGALGGRRDEPPAPDATPDSGPLALPAPNNGGTIFGRPPAADLNPAMPLGLPAPTNGGTIIPPGPVNGMGQLGLPAPEPITQRENPEIAGAPTGGPALLAPAGGSSQGQPAAPVPSSSLGMGAAVPALGAAPTPGPVGQIAPPVTPPAPPAGPVEAIAQQIAAATPAPLPEPAPRFPDQKPGATVTLGNEDGANENAVFLRETPTGALVRIQGQEVELTPEQFDAARNQAEVNKNREATSRGELGGISVAASLGAKPAPRIALTVEEEFARMSPDEARKRLAGLEAGARQRGWNTRTSNLRKILEGRIALGGTTNVESAGAGNETSGQPAPVRLPDGRADGGQGTATGRAAVEEGAQGSGRVDQRPEPATAEPGTVGGDLGGLDVADGAGKLGAALNAARAAGQITHTTKKGKPKVGYVLQGVTKAEADAIDPYSFRKDGGIFVNAERADAFAPVDVQKPAESERQAPTKAAEAFKRSVSASTIADMRRGEMDPELVDHIEWLRDNFDAVAPHMQPEDNPFGRFIEFDVPARRADLERRMAQNAPGAVAQAAADVAPEPTDAQKEAGNYRKGHARWNGLDLSIETAKGQERSGTGADGKPWSVTMPADYGYIRRTEGADGDQVDFYMGPNEASDFVLVVDQKDLETGAFDEHKVVLGANDAAEAMAIYEAGFSDGRGRERIGGVREMHTELLRAWLDYGDLTKPVSRSFDGPARPVQPTTAQEVRAEGSTKPERDPIQKAKDRVMRLRREKPNSPELKQAEADLRKARQNAFADEAPADPSPVSTAPEHAAVGVDPRELSEIVTEFNDAQDGMTQDGERIHHLFDAPKGNEVVRLGRKAEVRSVTQDGKRVWHRDKGWMTPEEARALIEGWKEHARAQGKTGENRDKVVLSLFDLTGSWSQPWEDAGYQVFRFDIQADPEMGDVNNFSTEFFSDWFGDFDGMDIYAILAACPCTDFATSGSRHFAAKDKDGRTVASVKLVHQTLATIEHFRPAVWAIENPVGRIEKLGGLPPWRLSFEPFHLGDTYTKTTLLWGRFNGDLPVAPVDPVEGSKMHQKYGGKSLATKNARSATPEGFAYGFFMANNASDHPAMAVANKFDRLDRDLIEQAIDAGVTPDAITEAVSDFYYMDMDDAAANQAIRDLMKPSPQPDRAPVEDAEVVSTTPPQVKPATEISPRAKAVAKALGMDAMYARRIHEEAEAHGWDKLAFQFKLTDGGRHSFVWTDATGKVISRMAHLGSPAALKRGDYRDPISGFTEFPRAGFKPADLFRPSLTASEPVTAADIEAPVEGLRTISSPEIEASEFAAAIGAKANRPMADLSRLDFDAWDDKTREDGQNSPAKRQGRDETGRWARAVVKALTDVAGMAPVTDKKGKAQKPVSHGYGMASELDETNISLAGRNGVQVFVKMTGARRQGEGQSIYFQITGNPEKPGYSRPFIGSNTSIRETATPAEAAALIARAVERAEQAAEQKAARTAADQAVNKPAAQAKPKTEKQQLFERFQNAIREGNTREIPTLRRLMVQMVGEPATAQVEQEAWDSVPVDRQPRPAAPDASSSGPISAAPTAPAPRPTATEGVSNSGYTPDAADPAPAASGIAAALSPEDQARMAELKKKLAARLRNQANSGLDPEILGMAVELTGLYIKAGARKFGAMLRDFMADTGLSAKESQRYMRAAYGDVRDDMDLNGEDVSGFDTADQVMAEVRKALAEETAAPAQSTSSQEAPDRGSIGQTAQKEDQPDDRNGTDESDDRAGAGRGARDPEAGAERPQGTRRGRGGEDASQSRPEPDAGRSGRGRDDAGNGDGRGDGRTDDARRVEAPQNHVIPEGGLDLPGGEKTRARNAIKAIEIVRTLEREGRPATADERAALAKYGGAGVLAPALPNSAGRIRMQDIAADLDRLLTPEERATVEKTSQYAFYTAEPVLRNMWALAQRLGFKGGQVFEPGMGVGGFAGTMPAGVNGRYHGIELDHITAKIAAALYPGHHIKHGDFIQTAMPRDFYDLVIGNPPFSQTKITADPAYPQGFMIHDYFFAKSLDAVRPGGLLMFVTSAGTMNKRDAKARNYLADRADLVGAVRLPNTAFAENGTQVTTDIIVLRKRLEGEAEANPAWRESTPVSVPDGKGGTVELNVNRYFQANPEMILGEQGAFDTLVGAPRIGVRPREGANLARDLRTALSSFPENIMSAADPRQMMDGPRDATSAETKTGSYYLKDGELWQFDGREGKPVQRKGKSGGGMSKADYELISQLVPIRNALRAVYAADLAETDATQARADLNRLYDEFVAKNGPINKVVESYRRPSNVELEGMRQRAAEDARSAGLDFDIGSFDAGPMIEAGASMAAIARARLEASRQPGYREGTFDPEAVPDKVLERFPNIDAFRQDPESFRLRAIEKFDRATGEAVKTRVFTENAVKRAVQPKISSPEDALLYLLADTGRIDLDRIAELAGSTPATVRAELKGKIFENPATGEFETRTRYLSGNVRQKLAEAEAAIARDIRFAENAEELRKVIPDPIPRSGIVVPLGAHWFDHGLYAEFAKSKGLRLEATFRRALGRWSVDGDESSPAAKNEWGTEDVPFAEMMRRAMNNKPMRVTRTVTEPDGSKRSFVDEEATQAAADKAAELQAAFSEWLWSDEARADALEERYNEVFNAEVAPVYDGAYLTTPGINSGWTWRPHQTAVVARILQSGNTYMAHAVGAGKTSAMIGAGMEARRLGLAQRPWYSVPNHMLVQFATEFQEQYPLANILVADENNFQGDRRRQFVADAASGDYDAVIITHSAFELIPSSPAAKAAVIEDMLSDLRDLIEEQSDNPRDREAGQDQAVLGALKSVAAALGIKEEKEKGVSTAKKIAQMMEQAEQRLAAMTQDTGKDEVFTFDEIGVDMLFVDEAHLFRKLSFATTNGTIKGIDPKGSSMSMDLFIKSRSVERRNPGRGLVLASGTPITNTMAELYSLQRFMQPQALADRNMSAFDAWAATFGQVASELEQTPDGGYKEVSRFSKFVNTPELSLMVRQVMDIVTSSDLEKYVTRPKLRGGGRNLVVIEATPEQKAYQQELARRMRAMQQRKGPPKPGDDIMLNVVNDGRLAAIDMRLVDPNSTGEGSKLERLIQNVFAGWKAGANAPLHGVKPEGGYTDQPVMRGPTTQIVFSTLGVNPSKHNPGFSVHRYIKASLIRLGVPESDIIMANDLKSHIAKQRAFNDMNEGKRRILIGSKSIFTGVNAQRRLAQIHNLDPLWYPADDEQRNGRGIRQGNMNPEIAINDYSTKGTYDSTMWQMMERKAGFISGFYRGDPTMRDMEDLGEESAFAQAKAMTTSDPRILQLTEMKTERDKLRRRAGAIDTQRSRLRAQIRSAMRGAEYHQGKAQEIGPIVAMLPDLSGEKFKMRVGKTEFESRKDAGEAIMARAEAIVEAGKSVDDAVIGSIGGFPVELRYSNISQIVGLGVRHSPAMDLADADFSDDPVGLIRKLEYALKKPERYLEFYQNELAKDERAAVALREQLAGMKDFADQDKLNALDAEIAGLEAALLADAAAAEAEASANDAPKESRFTDGEQITPADARRINAAARAELEKVGIAGRVRAEVGGTGAAAGTYQRGVIRILRARSGKWRHTLDHEILHALRDPAIWDGEAGLFTRDEWRALVRAARADKEIAARVEEAYADLDEAGRVEEMVAELYADWAQGQREAPAGPVRAAFERIRSFFRAVASALRGEGFQDAARIMERIANGEIGGRGPDGPGGGARGQVREQRDMGAIRDALRAARGAGAGRAATAARAMFSRDGWKKSPEVFSNWLTDAMGKNERFNVLGAVPGHALFAELGKNLSAAQTYLKNKQAMDAERNDWQARAAAMVDKWSKAGRKDREANTRLMDLMHESTLAGIDPSKPDAWQHPHAQTARRIDRRDVASPEQRAFARRVAQEIADHDATYSRLKTAHDALPAEFQSLYSEIRDEYAAMADATDNAVLENVSIANEVALKRARRQHAKEMQRIKDEGLTGSTRDEAVDQADARLAATEKRARANGAARIASLRAAFETNRMEGPYFPLARFGNYFVTIRDGSGKVISFSRFEKAEAQQAAIREAQEDGAAEGWKIEHGVLGGNADLKGMVDPRFVSEVEGILAETGASPETMDAIWQHWLETLPDRSVRKSRIHRKGRKGFNQDAVRAFSSAMFHGAHNLARLRHGLRMDENLNDAEEQAARQPDPERAGFVVREMRQRHAFTMKPTNNPLVTAGTSLAFVWYLGMSPAAAMVNITQTTVFGIPILGTRFRKAGVTGAADALARASADFARGKGWAERSKNLTADERAAMQRGYELGTIDKTQAHDLAAVAESGVEYRPGREKAMRVIGFLFHHAERLNREVTFLAAYRLARKEGMAHEAAIDEAAALTWRTHFDYQNTSRPRMMQGDFAKIILTFRNFTVNALYRMFRDTHQAFAGATPEARREAKGQLIGVTLSMMAHAGIKGVWGFGLLMGLLGLFFPGSGDDMEDWLQDALLVEGDGLGTASWNWMMGMLLHGVPGHAMGVSMTERVGMPNLWFRPPREGTEGQDLWTHYLQEVAGPVVGIGGNFVSGLSMIADAWGDGNAENMLRGAERITPNFVSNGVIKPARFMTYGANTYRGDPLMEVGPLDALRTVAGFTPAQLAERYRINGRLRAAEKQVMGQRASIHRAIGKAIEAGEPIPDRVMRQMREFNATYPEYPITADTIRQSIRSRATMKQRNEWGLSLNPRLNDRLRGELPQAIYS